MPIPTAPALLVGLGARILIDVANRANTGGVPRLHEIILIGAWQGVALQFAGKNVVALAVIALSILVKLVVDFSAIPDATRAIATIIGVALGMVGTDLLSSAIDQAFDSESPHASSSRSRPSSSKKHVTSHDRDLKRKPSSRPLPRERLVQWHASVQGGSVTTEPLQSSDITSVDGIFNQKARSMAPLEQEIAALRAKASLADSERRRCREERKWALSQGNEELAGELKANYKRFKALMEECHKAADAKLLESAKAKSNDEYRDIQPSRQGSFPARTQPVPAHLRNELARTLRDPRLPPLSTSSSSAAPERPHPPPRTRKVSGSKPSPRDRHPKK